MKLLLAITAPHHSKKTAKILLNLLDSDIIFTISQFVVFEFKIILLYVDVIAMSFVQAQLHCVTAVLSTEQPLWLLIIQLDTGLWIFTQSGLGLCAVLLILHLSC